MNAQLRTAALAAVLGGSMAMMPQQASALYVGMYAIGDYSNSCGGNDLSSWPGMVQAWWNEMGARGHYRGPSSSQYRYVDGNMILRRFCDPSFNSDCRDFQSSSPAGMDWMDAGILATHGWDNGDHWGGLMRWSWNGSCSVTAGGSSNQVRWGDSWIKFAHISSCFSADKDNLDGIRFAMARAGATKRAHQWDGFHGIMWISSGYNGNYKNTAKHGHSNSVAHAWVTNHYKKGSQGCEWHDPFNWFGTCRDQCPVAYSIGTSASDALTRLNNERYNNVLSNPGGNNWYAYKYYAGCHPVGESAW